MPVVAAIILARKGGLYAFRRGFFAYLACSRSTSPSISRSPAARGDHAAGRGRLARGFAWAVNIFYGAAPPWNAFPSFHVAGCWFFYRVLARWRRGRRGSITRGSG